MCAATCAEPFGRAASQLVAVLVNRIARDPLGIRVIAARRARGEVRIDYATLVGRRLLVDVRSQTLIEVTAAANRLVHTKVSAGDDRARSVGAARLQPFEQRASAARDTGHHRADRHIEDSGDFGI